MKNYWYRIFILSSLGVVMTTTASCANQRNEIGATHLTKCEEPRPEICTQQYVPVCAQLIDSNKKTFSNGCNACSDAKVIGFEPGECTQLKRSLILVPDELQSYATEKPNEEANVDKCTKLSKKVKALRGKPQRHYAAKQHYEAECVSHTRP